MKELIAFDDEDSGQMVQRCRSCIEGLKNNFGIFKAALELVPVGEEDVFAVGLECIELKRNIAEFFLRFTIELVDISGGFGVGLKDGG